MKSNSLKKKKDPKTALIKELKLEINRLREVLSKNTNIYSLPINLVSTDSNLSQSSAFSLDFIYTPLSILFFKIKNKVNS